MKPTLRVVAGLLALSLLAVGCTSSGAQVPTPSPTESSLATPTATISAPPGSVVYRYENAGVTATLEFRGTIGTLEVKNQTDGQLAVPRFYILDARDGRRVNGTVEGAAPIPGGKSSTFDVSFTGLNQRDVGMIVLVIGSENYGAFARQ